ncbi:hypothetical protein AB0E08_29875 [Streptomyces sp. NPDC048281]|uniref:hypothetical protein n=1 Tax=Streptomyces sp. NPDC048281 TaxID=3154715 RepID=UPI00342471BC
MAATVDAKEWAGTTEDMYDLHRFKPDRRARCNAEVRTYSRTTGHDAYRDPYMTLRTRAQIAATGFGWLYHFCEGCMIADSAEEK